MTNRITLILIIIILLGACNVPVEPEETLVPTFTQTLPATQAQEPTVTSTLTSLPTVLPPSETTTIELPSATPTGALFPEFTPTQITATYIIEITPLGGQPTEQTTGLAIRDYEGVYVPNSLRNVRKCPTIGNACPVIRQLQEGELAPVYGLMYIYPQKDIWVCLDPPPAMYVSTGCWEVAAYITGEDNWGTLYREE